jgi:hypothetical protein
MAATHGSAIVSSIAHLGLEQIFIMKPGKCFLLALLTSSFLIGCASTQAPDWEARIGNYSHDRAVLDLGPPDRSATLSDGTIVSEWTTGRSAGHVVSLSHGGYYGHRYGSSAHRAYVTAPVEWIIRLTFDPQGNLNDWKEVTR